MLGTILVSAFLIGLNALFVLMEFALVRVRSSRIEMLARRGNQRALGVQEILAHLDEYLAAIQMGITIVALSLGWVAEPALAHWIQTVLSALSLSLPEEALTVLSFALALALLAWGHIVFGELLPRSIGIQQAELVTLWGAYPLRLFILSFRIPVAFMAFCSLSLLKLVGFKSAAQAESVVSEEEMRILLGETQEKGNIPLERLLLLENLFDFGKALAAEVMVPREKIAFFSLKKSWEKNLKNLRLRHFSRYPLCEDGLDSAIGMVHVKDFLLKADGSGQIPELRSLKRDLAEVRETDSLEKLLKTFPDKGIHMALVKDAQGHPSGLITLEDIMEELVGEVHDEFDIPHAWSLVDLIVVPSVAVGLQASEPREAISQLLSKLLVTSPGLPGLKEEEVFKSIWEREMKFSSAVGRGVAIPHARLPQLERSLVALGRFLKPVPFPSPDNVPVRLIFLILTPAAFPVLQLKVLGRIAALMTNENLRRRLLRAKTAESMLEILRTADTLLA
jgi:CBS domain containing-hemolysin-like protein/mannitol/fructose-specific phosphotransferase system IIA component (Ntr-type)